MNAEIGLKIKSLRRALNESQAVFGDRFGVEQATVSRWEKGLPVGRPFEEMIAGLAGMSVAEFFHSSAQPRLIPIIGEMFGGETFAPTDDAPQTVQVEHISLDLGLNDQVALRVRGDAMSPVYRDGDIIIGRKLRGADIDSAIGRDCIVKTIKNDGHVKVLRPGSKRGVYTLRSYNPKFEDMVDVALRWAAPVIWIHRM